MKPGENFETSMVGLMVMLVALVERIIGLGYYNSRILFGRPFMSTFFHSFYSVNRYMTKVLINKLREILFLIGHIQLGEQYYCIFEG